MVGGVTDWLDGKLARLLDQYSTLGALLDPAVDRLYILAALVALAVREVVPWWAVAVLVGRDLVLGACLPVLRARGYAPFRVTYLGKSATFLLLYAFPLLLLGVGTSPVAPLARPIGYAFAVWGTGALPLLGAALPRAVRAGPAPPAGRRRRGRPGDAEPRGQALGSARDPGRPALHRRPRVGARGRRRGGAGGHHRLRAGAARATSSTSTCPRSGTRSRPATPCGEVESTKSVSEIYAPVSGEVVAVNGRWRAARSWSTPARTTTGGCSRSDRAAPELDAPARRGRLPQPDRRRLIPTARPPVRRPTAADRPRPPGARTVG